MLPAAKWSVAAALAVTAAALLWLSGASAADDPHTGVAASSNGVLLVAGQVASDSYGLYLVDTQSHTICVYQWVPANRKMRLIAARNYGFDLQLDDYNNEKETSPAEIRKLVEQQRRLGGTTRPN
jgi:hypothetical protein